MAASSNRPKTIKELREARRLTRADLERRVGVAASDLAKWEAGTATWDVVRLPDLAKAFGVALSEVAMPPRHRYIEIQGHPLVLKARGRDDGGWYAEVVAHYAGDATSAAVDPPEAFYARLSERATGRTADEALDALAADLDTALTVAA